MLRKCTIRYQASLVNFLSAKQVSGTNVITFLLDIDAFKGPDGKLGTAFNDGRDCLSQGQNGFDVAAHAHLLDIVGLVLVVVVVVEYGEEVEAPPSSSTTIRTW
jgi:hypothetical protein